MKWSVVDGMKLKPYRCIACGSTPRETSEEGMPQKPAFFCEGVDVNWGDSLYLCASCVNVLGQLAGMAGVEEHAKLETKYEALQKKYEELDQEHDRQAERIDRMLDGVKAKKEAETTRQRRSSRKKEPTNA